MGMPPHAIIIGIPDFIMAIMRLQHSANISADMPAIGIISQTILPSFMAQVIVHIIMGIGIGIIIGIMGMLLPIIGIMPPIIMGFIIGIIAGVAVMVKYPVFKFCGPAHHAAIFCAGSCARTENDATQQRRFSAFSSDKRVTRRRSSSSLTAIADMPPQ